MNCECHGIPVKRCPSRPRFDGTLKSALKVWGEKPRGDWIQTFTGRQYWPASPHADDVDILDIAHALSMLCRYTGHVDRFYSVAEHSWHVSYLVPAEHALAGLLHDATEAYLGDVSRPLKASLPDYRAIEERNWEVISAKFGLSMFLPECVHEADASMLTVEKAQLMKAGPKKDWGFPAPAQRIRLLAWRPEIAEELFLKRFHEMTVA